MKNSLGLLGVSLCLALSVQAEERSFVSPDGKIKVVVTDEQGTPDYTVSYNNEVFILQSPLGLKTNIGDFTEGMTLKAANSEVKQINEAYELATIKQRKVNYVANEAVCTFEKDGKVIYDIIFRVSNRDVAFKYRMYPQRDTRSCIVQEEVTAFQLPEGTTTFLCPQVKPMGGFARTYPSYETPYTVEIGRAHV